MQNLEWRRKNRIDFIREEFSEPEVLIKYYPFKTIGCDKLGQPRTRIINFSNLCIG